MRTPVSMLVIKVASHCNLNCSYCYEYNMGDESWRSKPRVLSVETAKLIGRRIREHCTRWQRNRFAVSLHGGEPLLARIEPLTEIVHAIRGEAAPDVIVDFGMQTNAMLVTPVVAETLAELKFSVGVSIDGSQKDERPLSRYRNRKEQLCANARWHPATQSKRLAGGSLPVCWP